MNSGGTFTRRCVSANESKVRSESKYSVSQIRLHSSAAASAPASLRSLRSGGTLLVYSPRKKGVSPPILSRAPRRRGASTLSVRHRIYEAEY